MDILKEEIKCLKRENELLKKENKILKENAEHNSEVVDDFYWENLKFRAKIKYLEKENESLKGRAKEC